MKDSRLLSAVALAVALTSPAHAQGFLGKLAEKLKDAASTATSGSSGGISSSDARAFNDDKADQSLDKRSDFKADKRGVGGIYYANLPIGARSLNDEKGYVIGKVYLEYDDATGVMTMYTRHAFEANDPAKLVPKGKWYASSSKQYLEGMRRAGKLYLRDPDANTSTHYAIAQYTYRTDLQGNAVRDQLIAAKLGPMLELEPGVLYVGETPYASPKKGGRSGHNFKPDMNYQLFYKAGKEEAVKTWTPDRIIDVYDQTWSAIEKGSESAGSEVDTSFELKTPYDEPITRAELAGMKAQWQRMIARPEVANYIKDRRFKLVYAYPESPWAENRKKQWVNNSYVDTIWSRSRVVISVFQDQDGKYWTNKFFFMENAPAGVFFGERWNGQYDMTLASTSLPKAITKDAALKYQNAIKVK